jgi:hypothetical protein
MTSTADTIREAAASIEAAVHVQRRADPHHVDFHDIARAVERTTAALHDLTTCLHSDLAHYGSGRRLRTDIDLSPTVVLAEAVDHCDVLRSALDDARTAADLLANRCGRLASA